MTEEEWLAARDSAKLLNFISVRATERKLRLFACAYTRRLHPLFSSCPSVAVLLNTAERVADNKATQSDLNDLLSAARRELDRDKSLAEQNGIAGVAFTVAHPPSNHQFRIGFLWLASGAAWNAAPHARADPDDWGIPSDPIWRSAWDAELNWQCSTLRDIFDNPFRPSVFVLEWSTSTVLALAAEMYASRDFSAMPILADALQDAGCNSDEILNHCRGEGPHVRGCWVVDLVLGL